MSYSFQFQPGDLVRFYLDPDCGLTSQDIMELYENEIPLFGIVVNVTDFYHILCNGNIVSCHPHELFKP